MTEQRVPARVLQAVCDKRLERHHAKVVFALVFDFLKFEGEGPKPVKIRETARMLRIRNHREVRYALDLLVRKEYLRFTHSDSKGIRYYEKLDQRGPTRPPSTSPLTDAAA